ncbi:MAG: hypothetical protein HONBIEJF_02650 [Fimbriimonadaceae bacterium]|nr:hypothetical protein [Fimbriimonadaceae bacterium]
MMSRVGACLWDSDTIHDEINGKLTLQNAIAGRIDRNPPEYYELRLEIVKAKIKSNPRDVAAYDDAAVACDRLGLHDEGLQWLAKKRAVLDPSDDDALYKTLANEGTIRFHRWLAKGHSKETRPDAIRGRDQIAEAIRINPEAHFGREAIQLLVMDWTLQNTSGTVDALDVQLPYYIARHSSIPRERRQEGLIGLMMLGTAWESVDILYALAEASLHSEASVRLLIRYRIAELEDRGKSSMSGSRLAEAVHSATLGTQDRLAQEAFRGMRANADRYQEVRTRFILDRIGEGKHPDTHADFWDGYQPVPSYVVPAPGLWDTIKVKLDNPNFLSNLMLPVAGLAILGAIARYAILARRRREKPPVETVT